MKKILLLCCLVLLPSLTEATTVSSVLLTAQPENPRPGQQVTVTATLISGDPQVTDFFWSVDGVAVGEGGNLSSLTVTAPPAGEVSEVSVATSRNGSPVGSASLTVRPAEVTIEWEGPGLRPPFYIGRPQPSSGTAVTAVAVPMLVRTNGTFIPSSETVFTWKVGDTIQTKSSGVGRDTLRITPPFFNNSFVVSVKATARDGSIAAEQSVTIIPRTPEIVFYEVSPLAGLEDERAIVDSYPFTREEVSFKAYPLHVESTDGLTPVWTLNRSPIQLETGDPFLAVFRKTGAGSGAYEIGLSFTHVTDFLRKASANFLLTF